MKTNFLKTLLSIVIATPTMTISGDDIMKHLTDFYHNRRVLVTGGCGFIGSHLAETLVHLGAKVTIIDDLSTGSLENIAAFADKIQFVHDSIVNPDSCDAVMAGQDIVFHQAAYISVPGSVLTPGICHAVNVTGTFNLLESARKYAIQRFIYASSAAVYGQKEGICTEDSPTQPVSPYGASKLIKEVYAQQYARTYGINTIGLRYFNVYGPRQNPHGSYSAAIAKFRHQMRYNLPITIFGDGTQTRDFIPVDEVVMANLILATLDAQETRGQVYNIATGMSITLLDMIEKLKKEFPEFSAPIEFQEARPGDVKHSAADCNRYHRARLPRFLGKPDDQLQV